jgi:hypothetical protein
MVDSAENLSLLSLLGEENCLDVGENTALSDGNSRQELVQLLIIANSQLKVTRNDARLLVVTSSVASQLEDFSTQVFHDGSEVNRGSGSNTFSVVSLTKEAVDPTNRELKTGTT